MKHTQTKLPHIYRKNTAQNSDFFHSFLLHIAAVLFQRQIDQRKILYVVCIYIYGILYVINVVCVFFSFFSYRFEVYLRYVSCFALSCTHIKYTIHQALTTQVRRSRSKLSLLVLLLLLLLLYLVYYWQMFCLLSLFCFCCCYY